MAFTRANIPELKELVQIKMPIQQHAHASPMRVLLVCDREYWILCDIARNLAQILAPTMQVSLLIEYDVLAHLPAVFARQQRQHDVVHLLGLGSLAYHYQRIRLPCVVTLWHMEEQGWAQFDATIDRADLLFVGSQQWLERARPHVPPRLPVRRMPYGVDTARFQPDPAQRSAFLAQHGLPADTLVIGFAANVEASTAHRKGLDRFWECLQALAQVATVRFVVRLIGRGWEAAQIPPALQPRIVNDAFIERADLPRFYASLDYYLCTSRIEGVPYPVLEAMASSCVVLSTPVGIVPEIITDQQNGFLLREEHIAADFVAALARTAPAPQHRQQCGHAARRTILSCCDWATSVPPATFAAAYATAIQHHRLRPYWQHARYAYHDQVGRHIQHLHGQVRQRLRSLRHRLTNRTRP